MSDIVQSYIDKINSTPEGKRIWEQESRIFDASNAIALIVEDFEEHVRRAERARAVEVVAKAIDPEDDEGFGDGWNSACKVIIKRLKEE